MDNRLINITVKSGLATFLAVLFSAAAISTLVIQAAGPLPNGVAAGDTRQTSTVLWTRATSVGEVLFEYSTDPTFGTNVLSATATAADVLQPVKVELSGLSPASTYYYRITGAAAATAQGHFRTATSLGTHQQT